MVDSGEEEEEEEEASAETEISSSIEWAKIHYSRLHCQSLPDPPLKRWSMETHDQPSTIIFPPIHHENLHFSNHSPYHHTNGTLSSPYDPDPRDPPLLVPAHRPRWLDWGLRFLRCRMNGFSSSIRNFVSTRGVFWSFRSPAGAATVAVVMLLFFMYLRLRRLLRVPKESVDDLIRIIKKNDEKMDKLMHEIGQMNQLLLLALHRVPPPVSKSG